MQVFYKLKINDNDDLSKLPHKEEYNDDNYESIEEFETAV